MPNQIIHKDSNNKVIYQINKTTKRGKYFPIHADKLLPYLDGPIILKGFDRLPKGFYKDGFGLTTAGSLVIQQVSQKKQKRIKLTVTSSKSSTINLRGKTIALTLSEDFLVDIGNKIRIIKRERNAQMIAKAQNSVGNLFTQYKDLKNATVGYIPGKLGEILGSDADIISKLGDTDRLALEELIPEYLQAIPGTIRSKKKLKIIFDALDAGKTIYLEKALKEFRKKLDAGTQNENVWQKFLSEYILLLRHNYGEVLEKTSVSLQGKFPDFMLVDPYGYLDIYEIKKPSTELMRLDDSRNNHYWDVELSKAIAQVENYIHQVQRHADALMNDIRSNRGIDVTIVRPRGYIIAGLRTQLKTNKMKNDFRILCDSLKNVDVILYDDLYDSLKSFVDKSTSK